ncbi:MAG TPA: DNA topology modulation protein [Sedimentibacter sp.]|nr:DNA topology modulation protein [Sedimentibacter sp.]
MKIAIIGYAGSGKSTLARQLGKFYNIPVLHMDKIQFEHNWIERDEEIAKNMVEKFMNENKSWVIDGNYTKFHRERRLNEADEIIFMNYSRWVCLWQAFKRYIKYKGKTRECIADGCIEKLDLEFIKWILKDGRDEKHMKRYEETIKKHNSKTNILRNRIETDLYLKKLFKV